MKSAISSGNAASIKSSTEELMSHLQQLGGQMYQDAGTQAPPPGAENVTGDGDEDVIDAEFTET